jgi:hypothetical protein
LRRCYARIEPGDQGSSTDRLRRGWSVVAQALGFRRRKTGKNSD